MSHLCHIIRTDRQVLLVIFLCKGRPKSSLPFVLGFPLKRTGCFQKAGQMWKMWNGGWSASHLLHRLRLLTRGSVISGACTEKQRAWMRLKFAGEDPQKTLWKAPSGAEIPPDMSIDTATWCQSPMLRVCLCVSGGGWGTTDLKHPPYLIDDIVT